MKKKKKAPEKRTPKLQPIKDLGDLEEVKGGRITADKDLRT